MANSFCGLKLYLYLDEPSESHYVTLLQLNQTKFVFSPQCSAQWAVQICLVSWNLFFGACNFCILKVVDFTGIL